MIKDSGQVFGALVPLLPAKKNSEKAACAGSVVARSRQADDNKSPRMLEQADVETRMIAI